MNRRSRLRRTHRSDIRARRKRRAFRSSGVNPRTTFESIARPRTAIVARITAIRLAATDKSFIAMGTSIIPRVTPVITAIRARAAFEPTLIPAHRPFGSEPRLAPL